MDSVLMMADKWQTYAAVFLMLVASVIYLVTELHKKGLWITLAILAPAVIVLLWAITVPDTHETFISGAAVAFGLFAMVFIALPLPLNITAAVISVRNSLTSGGITPLRILPLASGSLAIILLLSAWIPIRHGVKIKEAIEGRKIDALRSLVKCKSDANKRIPGDFYTYPLHIAVNNGQAAFVALLLGQGAEVAQRDKKEDTPLTSLLKDNHMFGKELGPEYDEVVALLIKGGSPVTSEDMWGIFNLQSHSKTVDAFNIRLFTSEKMRASHPELGYYLKTAIQMKENAIVEKFLATGGSLDFRDAEGDPLLLTAFDAKNDVLAQHLMKRGADVTVRTTPPRIKGESEFHERDVYDYLGGLKESTVRMLFKKTPNLKLDKALYDAAAEGNLKVMALVLDKAADINDVNAAKTNALFYAVSNDQAEAVRFLLNHGADVNLAASPEETVLMFACEDHPKMALLLLKHGGGTGPRLTGAELAKASGTGHLELVEALVKYGANVNARDEHGHTPWRNAVIRDYEGVAKYLAAHGADTTSESEH